jgi:hypothetical protein
MVGLRFALGLRFAHGLRCDLRTACAYGAFALLLEKIRKKDSKKEEKKTKRQLKVKNAAEGSSGNVSL